jgi:hypothetical protein
MSKKRGQFLLSWGISFLVAQPLVVYYFSRMPSSNFVSPWVLVRGFVTSEAVVAAISAVAIFVLAQPLEKRFSVRSTGALAAAFTYLGILAAAGILIMAAMTPLIALFRLEGALIYWPAIVGMAALVSAPVAFVSRWLYSSILGRARLTTIVLLVGVGLAVASLLGGILFQVAFV